MTKKTLLTLILFFSFTIFLFAGNNFMYQIKIYNDSAVIFNIQLSNTHEYAGSEDAWIHYSSVDSGSGNFAVGVPKGQFDFDGVSSTYFSLNPGESAEIAAHAYWRKITGSFARVPNPGCIHISMFTCSIGSYADPHTYTYESNHGNVIGEASINGSDIPNCVGISPSSSNHDFCTNENTETDEGETVLKQGADTLIFHIK